MLRMSGVIPLILLYVFMESTGTTLPVPFLPEADAATSLPHTEEIIGLILYFS
jgi:hypothetical protein